MEGERKREMEGEREREREFFLPVGPLLSIRILQIVNSLSIPGPSQSKEILGQESIF